MVQFCKVLRSMATFGGENNMPILGCEFVLCVLTLTVLVTTIDAQWEGMGDVGSARYEPALLPPCPDHKGFKLQ